MKGRHQLAPAALIGLEDIMTEPTLKPTGTTGAPNPQTGSSDAARGLGGHSKDADHSPGSPAEFVEKGVPTEKD